jgi:hypothetical protein
MQIEIGNKNLKNITIDELLEIIAIEGCCTSLEYWNKPICTEFNSTMFSGTVVIKYFSTRKKDNTYSNDITFYFNFNNFDYHFHREDRTVNSRNRLKIESIRYLIQRGYHIPLY